MESNTQFSRTAQAPEGGGGGKPNSSDRLNSIIKKTNICIVLTILFLLLTGFAAGTPVEISTFSELMAINDPGNLSGDYILMNDINAEFEIFTPIGNRTDPFTGTFDGKGNTISNLTYTNIGANYVGLFGYIDSASISNLSLENVHFGASGPVGSFVGQAESSNISNCNSTGNIMGSDLVGGFAGCI